MRSNIPGLVLAIITKNTCVAMLRIIVIMNKGTISESSFSKMIGAVNK